MKEWIKDLLPLFGVVVGAALGWLSSRYQLRYQEARDRKRLILEKLEELHELLSRYSYGLYSMMQQSTMNELEDISSRIIPPHMMPKRPENDVEVVSNDRLRALVGFYAPDLTEDLEELEKVGGDFCEMMIRSQASRVLEMLNDKIAQDQKTDDKKLNQQFEKVFKSCESIQRKVVELSKTYV